MTETKVDPMKVATELEKDGKAMIDASAAIKTEVKKVKTLKLVTTARASDSKPNPIRAARNAAKKAAKKETKMSEKKVVKKTKKVRKVRTDYSISKEALVGYNQRAIEAAKEKADGFTVKKGGELSDRLMQSTALFFLTYRKKNNLTSAQLAKKLKVNPTAISHLESGKRSVITLERIHAFAKALALKPEFIAASILSEVS